MKGINYRSEAFLQRTSRFLNTGTILLIDVCVAVLSSAVVLFLSLLTVSPGAFSGLFVIQWLLMTALTSTVSYLAFHTNSIIVRHTTLKDLIRLFLAVCFQVCLMLAAISITGKMMAFYGVLLFVDLFVTLVALVAVRIIMISVYDLVRSKVRKNRSKKNLLIVGTSTESVSSLSHIDSSSNYCVMGFLAQKANSRSYVLAEHPVFSYSGKDDLDTIVGKKTVEAFLFPTESEARSNKELIKYAQSNGIKTLIIPTVEELAKSGIHKGGIREIKIEDLLGRPEIKISMDQIRAFFKGKTVMVTGAAGSIGSELVRQIARMGVGKIVLFDNAETPMHNLRLELDDRFPELDYAPVIGDVRHAERLDFAFRKFHPDIVFHAAAYKHVPLMEENPCEAVMVNVLGSKNLAEKCLEYKASKMIMISTDKAVNPTNVMGCSKRIAEIYIQSLGLAIAEGKHEGTTKFVTTRFGNVLGSNGSVIPRFRDQIAAGGPVTVTHPEINRFFMTIPEACRLVMEAATLPEDNTIFAFDMGEPVKIDTLARRMIELAGFVPDRDIKIEYTGLRPGEKLYEEVLSNEENSAPTTHERIRIAKVRRYPFVDACALVNNLVSYSEAVDIPAALKLMVEAVPEFSCTNKFL